MRHARTYLMSSAVAAAAVLAGVTAGPSGLTANAVTHHAATHPGGLTSDAPVTVVASGLSGPRSLAWGPHGQLLVALAGVPGSACVGSGPTHACYGTTGEVADVSSGTAIPVATGLVSALAGPQELGPDGLAVVHGQVYTLLPEAPQAVPPGLPADLTAALKEQFGALANVTAGHLRVVADPGSVDVLWTEQHLSLDPHDYPGATPYGLTPDPRGGFYLVDSAANTLDSVDRHGNVQVLAWIPNPPAADAVPSCVAVGPDGGVYIGDLTGAGNTGTAANVYRYDPRDGDLTVWQSGFSAINGCGFAHGNFYVTELDTTGYPPTLANPPAGEVIQISRDGTRTVLGAGKLFAPAGFLPGPDGSIYVSNHCLIWPPYLGPGNSGPVSNGEVVKIG